MKISLSDASLPDLSVDLLALGLRQIAPSEDGPLAALADALGAEQLAALMKAERFEAKPGQSLKVPVGGDFGAAWIVLVGLGEAEDHEADARTIAQAAVSACKGHKSLGVVLPSSTPKAVRVAAEAILGAAYTYGTYKTGDRKPKSRPKNAVLVVDKAKDAALKSALAQGRILAESVAFARDLVNAPPNDMDPPALANAAKDFAEKHDVSCAIWNKKKIAADRMQLFLAVNRGSAVEPRLIHLSYEPKGAKKRVVFVGKGLTFDSGGLCIKPAQSMNDMKCDMAGAATTIGIVVAAARLRLPIAVHGIIGSTENMTGAAAYRPGDVFTSREGKTVEIINTDAEGRLVLADVLSYATELKPDYLIDHATLTGACMVALGPYTAGFFANDDELATRYLAAGADDGELFWRLPLQKELRASLDSDIADLKHTGNRLGGAITAALFLQEFVGDAKWAHVDIAGPAFLERPFGRSPKGGTGFGVTTGVRFLEALAGDA